MNTVARIALVLVVGMGLAHLAEKMHEPAPGSYLALPICGPNVTGTCRSDPKEIAAAARAQKDKAWDAADAVGQEAFRRCALAMSRDATLGPQTIRDRCEQVRKETRRSLLY